MLKNINDINAALCKDSSRAWTEAKNRFAIDEDKSFGIPHSLAPSILGTVICKKSTTNEGDEFINAQVHVTCALPGGRFLDDNVKIDSDMALLPAYGFKGKFAEMLPYIKKDSVEYRVFKPNGEGKTKSSRLFWQWDTDKLADANCPFKTQDVTADREEIRTREAEQRGDDGSDNFTAMSAEDMEALASMFGA